MASPPAAALAASVEVTRRHDNAVSQLALEELDRRWAHFLGLTATGTKKDVALEAAKLAPALFEALKRGDPAREQQYQDARTAWLRRGWTEEKLDELMVRIAGGEAVKTVLASLQQDMGRWYLLLERDPELKARWTAAMQAKAYALQEEILEIADEDGDDLQLNGTGNSAAVKRSELRVNTRRFLMESWVPKIFSKDAARLEAQVNVTVNHVDTLEAARQRRDQAISPKERAQATEAEIVVPALPPPVSAAERAAVPAVETKQVDWAESVAWLE